MGTDELDPGNAGPVLHLHHEPLLVAADTENDTVIAADAGMAAGLVGTGLSGDG